MKTFYVDRIISKNIGRTPENYLCLTDAVIGRSGWMRYRRHEIDPYSREGSPSDLVDVYRSPEELFSPQSMASALAKPVTDGHPVENVHLANHWELAAGNILNVRPGGTLASGERTLVADILVTKPSLADKILNGVRECSCAYSCTLEQTSRGDIQQTAIVYNHVAILPSGRGGREVRLQDSNENVSNRKRKEMFNDDPELIPMPRSRSQLLKMRSLGLVPATTSHPHVVMDSAPQLSIAQMKQALLDQKAAVARSRDAKRIREWNSAWRELNSRKAKMFDAAQNPLQQMEDAIQAARQRLRSSKPNRLVG